MTQKIGIYGEAEFSIGSKGRGKIGFSYQKTIGSIGILMAITLAITGSILSGTLFGNEPEEIEVTKFEVTESDWTNGEKTHIKVTTKLRNNNNSVVNVKVECFLFEGEKEIDSKVSDWYEINPGKSSEKIKLKFDAYDDKEYTVKAVYHKMENEKPDSIFAEKDKVISTFN